MNLSVRLRYAPRCGVEDAMVVQPRSPPAWFPHYWAPWCGIHREPPLSPGTGARPDARVWTLGLRASCATVRCRQWRRALVGGGWGPVRARGSARVLFSPAWVLFEARFHRSPPNEDFEATAWGPVPSAPRALSPRAARVPPSTVRISRFPRRISSPFEPSATPRRPTPAERASRAGLFALEKAPSADDRQQRLKTARGSRRHERDGRRRRPRHRGRGEGVGRGP